MPTFDTVVVALSAAGCVFADDEARLLVDAARSPAALAALVERRVAGEPLEHLLGWAEFCGLRIAVGPGVFVPRRRTELLVSLAAPLLRPGDDVVELCCGAAAVATALAAAVPGIAVHAVDADPTAVRYARRNLAGGASPASRYVRPRESPRSTPRVATRHVYQGDLDAPLPAALQGQVAVVVANAPYVPTHAIALMPPEARDHEPAFALDGGPDGLDVHRRIAEAAPRWLAPGGSVLIETSEAQAGGTAEALTRAGFVARVERSEELDGTAVVGALRS